MSAASILFRYPKTKGMTFGHAFRFGDREKLKCSGEMNSPCAILRRLWRLRIYGVKAPSRRAGPPAMACIFFLNT